MASFRSEWGRLLVKPWQMVGGLTSMLRFFGSATFAGILTAAAGMFGSVPWWTLPLVALIAFYLSLTAGMAWERAEIPQVEIGDLDLAIGSWLGGSAIGLFYVQIKNGPVPVKVRIKITNVESSGVHRLDRSWEGHWRSQPVNFDGSLDPRDALQYGLIGIGTQAVSRHPTLFVWSRECVGRYPSCSLDVPLEQQGITRVDIVVNCEAAGGQFGKPQERTFYIAPDSTSPYWYMFAATGETVASTERTSVLHNLRWFFDRFCTTVERIFGGRHNLPS